MSSGRGYEIILRFRRPALARQVHIFLAWFLIYKPKRNRVRKAGERQRYHNPIPEKMTKKTFEFVTWPCSDKYADDPKTLEPAFRGLLGPERVKGLNMYERAQLSSVLRG